MSVIDRLRLLVCAVRLVYRNALTRPPMPSRTPAPMEELRERDSQRALRELEALKNRMGDA